MDKPDLRVTKTRAAIERAMVALLISHDLQHITVQMVLDEAMVNRKTFYHHYSDKFDVVDTIISRLTENFTAALARRFAVDEDSADFPHALGLFYMSLLSDRDAILAVLTVHTEKHCLWDEWKQILLDSYRNHSRSVVARSDLEASYLNEIYATTVLTSIRWFLESDDPCAAEVVVHVSSLRNRSAQYGLVGLPFD